MRKLMFILLVLVPRLVLAQGEERIRSYDSLITVNPAGDMTVYETIAVTSTGDRIRHGIYRDFPTRYKDRYGTALQVDFQVLSVARDGRPEPWWTEKRDNGVRVYMGSKEVTLTPGDYTYLLTYRTDRQLGFFKEHDELYWNVAGNGWEFPMDAVTATVTLPSGAGVRSTEAYTGSFGDRGRDWEASQDYRGRAVFRTTRALNAGEGLTIVVTWPKGFVREPTGTEKVKAFITHNGSTVAGAAGILLLLVYYLVAWLKVGRDPESGVVIPRFEAPAGFSPAAVRYVMRMGFDDRAFAAAVVSMAVKGYLTIAEDASGDYTLTRKGAEAGILSRDEAQLAKQLFCTSDTLAIKTTNHSVIKQSLKDHRKSLAVDYEKIYFLSNKGTLVPGLVISVLALVIIVLLGNNLPLAGFMTVWLSGWTVGCATLVFRVVKLWKAAIRSPSQRAINGVLAMLTSLFALPFLAGEAFGLWVFATATSLPAVLCIFTIVLLNIHFYHLMKAPTIKGRRTMDQIEGLKLYLSVAEQDRLNRLHPPEKTPEVFEKFLPYALALDVEQEWCEQFADVLAAARAENRYANTWYAGSSFAAAGAVGLASSLAGLSSSISSSSSPPGSSSGSGGGGSSGGGGGGGGGGGW